MKLFFLETDTLFKIFKTIEKVPQGKKISVFIEKGNDFFQNDRRAKQVQELLEKKKLQATFIAKHQKTRDYYEKVWLPYFYEGKKQWMEVLNTSYLFLFNIKKFHQSIYQKRHYISYIIFGCEILVIGVILYLLYALIIPSSSLYITPEYEVEDIIYNFRYYPENQVETRLENDKLSIPYHRGKIKYSHSLTTNVANISSQQKPAQWSITVYNQTTQELEILSNTQFITDDGMIFKSLKAFTIPASTDDNPWTVVIDVRANDLDVYEDIIGERGNIPSDTTMYIKNLTESYFLKKIYAINEKKFTEGETISKGSITSKDVEHLEQELAKYVEENKEAIVRQSFELPDAIVLPFNELISFDVDKISTENKIGDIKSNVSGTISSTILVPYIKEKDLIDAIMNYLKQRKTNTQKLIDIDTKSIIYYDIKEQDHTILTIPTSVSAIFGYDFENDTNGIKEKIKAEITGKSTKDARNILLSYPEVASAEISIKPPWYNQIPTTKSRIIFKVK